MAIIDPMSKPTFFPLEILRVICETGHAVLSFAKMMLGNGNICELSQTQKKAHLMNRHTDVIYRQKSQIN